MLNILEYQGKVIKSAKFTVKLGKMYYFTNDYYDFCTLKFDITCPKMFTTQFKWLTGLDDILSKVRENYKQLLVTAFRLEAYHTLVC